METNEYMEIFLDESNEHLQSINDNLLELEKQPDNLDLVDEIFRSAHTLKGMAATMEFDDIASLTHKMENVLDKIRKSELAVSEQVIDILVEALEDLEEMVSAINSGEDGSKDVSGLVQQLEQIENGTGTSSGGRNKQETTIMNELALDDYQLTVAHQAAEQGYSTFQITVKLVDGCMLKAARVYMVFEVLEKLGEVIKSVPTVEELEAEAFEQSFSIVLLSNESAESIKSRIHTVSEIDDVTIVAFDAGNEAPEEEQAEEKSQHKSPQPESDKSVSEQEKASGKKSKHASSKTIRVSSDRIDHLMNLFEELVLDRGRLEDISSQLKNQELTDTIEHIARVSQDMQRVILTMRMVPVEQVFNRFPRMVRGLAKDLHKKIDLNIVGAETELDRTVIDEIGDPLVHLIRNSVDHGIESPEERLANGKPEVGNLTLRSYHSGNHVFIEIEDDGEGINREKVANKAIENGLLSADHSQSLKDEDVYQFIFASGFSTAKSVSDISGRGVGLDAVRMKIEALGGDINVESEPGKGSKFSIQLPLTLSILNTLLVHVQDEIYGIPLSSVIETVLLEEKEIMHVQRQKVMDFRGKVVPLVSLQDVFNVQESDVENKNNYQPVVIIKKADKMTGLMVDSFIGKKEVVLKSLGNYLKNVYAISGATILGNGQVSLIIDPNELIK
ncbi:chemotaxis protein CheA [Lentibacillus cibarius]|uniref:Chemotaxis protein CheA n=1 Tax=Lentibacillus cibarius TaxID=2583219 RepID=A0A549YEF3_9BACI|nr:chemotaxis protein CheA [Lentibacillus cibarius]TMN21394.1 chemotaxis protein CheA [Lentibacillus cibarius]TRM10273.1 chemotaxis protein CheA [Lentibacillus cibarius]